MLAVYRDDLITLGWPRWAADLEVELIRSLFTEARELINEALWGPDR